VRDPLGYTTTYRYDGAGRLISWIDATGNASTAAYDDSDWQTGTTDALGRSTTYTYDLRKRLTQITRPDGTSTQWTYDAVGHVLTEVDPTGIVTRSIYDDAGRNTAVIYADGTSATSTRRLVYDAAGRITTSIDPRQYQTQYTYDSNDHLTSIVDALGGRTAFVYDAAGQLSSRGDALNRVTTFNYDLLGRQTKITYADGTFSRTIYDVAGQASQAVDAAGHVTYYEYDGIGRVVRTTSANGTVDSATTSYAYDASGRMTRTVDALGRTTAYTYDAVGRLIGTSDPLNAVTTYAYDAAGQRVSTTDANGHALRYEYDALGQLKKTVYADNTFTRNDYDAAGRMLRKIDQAGLATNYSYDPAGRLATVANALNQATNYAYDPSGNLISVTDANIHTTQFEYDALGRPSRKVWTNGSFETFGYDAVSNRISHRSTDGNTNTASFDNRDHLTSVSYFDGQTAAFTYTATGLRRTATDARGTTTYTYDARNRVTGVALPDGKALTYTYDAVGNRLSLTHPGGRVVYTYDGADRLATVGDGTATLATYTYDPVGLRTRKMLLNGAQTDYSYDALNRLIGINEHKGPSPIVAFTYVLGAAGNRLSVSEDDGSHIARTEWTYDAAYRLLNETRSSGYSGNLGGSGTPSATAAATGNNGTPTFVPPSATPPNGSLPTSVPTSTPTGGQTSGGGNPNVSWQATFTYDAVGNRLTKTYNGATYTYAYNSLDQLVSGGFSDYGYDGRGNLISVSDGNAATTYTFDARDKATAITNSTGTTTYAYDTDGRRVRQTSGSTSLQYVWDEASQYGDVVSEFDSSDTLLTSYVLGNNELVSQKRGGVVSYYLQDAQNSVRTLTDFTGAVTDRYSYDAFGETRARVGSTPNDYRYAGQRFDSFSGLYNLRARLYEPSTGRFLSRDPAALDTGDPLELNRYVYTANNPINGSDPTGLFLNLGTYGLTVRSQRAAAGALAGAAGGFVGSSLLVVATTFTDTCGTYKFDADAAKRFIAESTLQGAVFGGAFANNPIVGLGVAASLLAQQVVNEIHHPSGISGVCQLASIIAGSAVGWFVYRGLMPPKRVSAGSAGGIDSPPSGGGDPSSPNGGTNGGVDGPPDAGSGGRSGSPGSRGPSDPPDVNGSGGSRNGGTGGGTQHGPSQSGTGGGDPSAGPGGGGEPGGCSFSADTLIATPRGEIPIGELRIGDTVLAYNESTGENRTYPIDKVFVNVDQSILHLTVDDETLQTTLEHPFYTEEAGWIAAGDLKLGEHVKASDGTYGVVTGIKLIDRTQKMFNLAVRTAHTFYVGVKRWLVHNTCVYRGDSRQPSEIKREGGFNPRVPGATGAPEEIVGHVEGGITNSAWEIHQGKYVSTSTSPESAAPFGTDYGKGYIYKISNVNGYSVIEAYRSLRLPVPPLVMAEAEVAFTRIPLSQILEYAPVHADGTTIGVWLPFK